MMIKFKIFAVFMLIFGFCVFLTAGVILGMNKLRLGNTSRTYVDEHKDWLDVTEAKQAVGYNYDYEKDYYKKYVYEITECQSSFWSYPHRDTIIRSQATYEDRDN